jgi:uncharacterized membrane protein
MVPFYLLIVATLAFASLGRIGVELWGTWQEAARYGLAAMLVFTGVTHFTAMREDYARMVPRFFPYPELLVAVSGVLELVIAAGLLIPVTGRHAALAATVLFVALFPANVNAVMKGIEFRGKPPTPLWLRLPVQLVFIAGAWWVSK